MDAYQAGYQAGVADHGEHHRCARCYAAGQAQAEARVAALERDSETGVDQWLAAEARVAALTAALKQYVIDHHARVAVLTAERDAARDAMTHADMLWQGKLDGQIRRVAALTAALKSVHACATYDANTGECGGCAVSTALDAAGGA